MSPQERASGQGEKDGAKEGEKEGRAGIMHSRFSKSMDKLSINLNVTLGIRIEIDVLYMHFVVSLKRPMKCEM